MSFAFRLALSVLVIACGCVATSNAATPSAAGETSGETSGATPERTTEAAASTAASPGPVSREATVSDAGIVEPLDEGPLAKARIAANCPSGRPLVRARDGQGALRLVTRVDYVLVHDAARRVPLFVCEGVSVEELTGSLHGHRPPWHADPALPADERAEDSDYRGSPYDRGHMAPAGDQTDDVDSRRETFFFSNVVPQDRTMNERDWNALEQEVRALLERRGGGYVVTGPIFAAERQPLVIGENHVGVPTHLFKVVVIGDPRTPDVYAFVYENRTYPSLEASRAHLTSIDDVEARTGLDFLPELDDAIEATVEARTAATFPP